MALKSFRDYSEHDVVNLFAYHGNLDVLDAGTVVKIDEDKPLFLNAGADATNNASSFSPANTVSWRWGVSAGLALSNSSGPALGITLMPVRNFDENGENLAFNPRKAAEMGVVIKGQPVPVLTRGLVTVSVQDNIVVVDNATTPPTSTPLPSKAGYAVYLATDGKLQTNQTGQRVGMLISPISNGVALAKLDFTAAGIAG